MDKPGASSRYEYKANANLVLEREKRGPRNNEPSGEAESLAGKLGETRMGDRVQRGRPAELEAKLEKAKKRRERNDAADAAVREAERRKRRVQSGVSTQLDEVEGATYRPKTAETRLAWEHLLGMVQSLLGDVPQPFISGAAEEALAILKDEEMVEPDRKRKLGELLSGRAGVSDELFARMAGVARAISDWYPPEAQGNAGAAGPSAVEEGVAVVFGDDDEEDEEEGDVVVEEGGAGRGGVAAGRGVGTGPDDDDEGVESSAEDASAVRAAGLDTGSYSAGQDEEAERAAGLLPPSTIDAFWLQRSLGQHGFTDATEAQRMAQAVLEALGQAVRPSVGPEAMRELENSLVALLDFERFDLIRVILKNAPRVYYLTRLRQAQTEGERTEIKGQMLADTEHDGPALLRRAETAMGAGAWAASRTADVSARVRKEAQALAARTGAGSGAGSGTGAEAEDIVMTGSASVVSSSVRPSGSVLGGAGGGVGGSSSTAAFHPSEVSTASGPAPQRVLNLDDMSFQGGGHTMTNRKVTLPEKSWRAQKKGYEEVHVPAAKPRPLAEGEREIPIAELPDWARPAFKGMTKLNRVQSKLCDTALYSSENMLLCAPTGAGKTNVAVLSILHEIGASRQADGSFDKESFKVVYVAPMKALVQEVVSNFTGRLGPETPYGLVIRELSGDVSLTKAEIAETQIIVTTPEKWDVITRKSGERAYTQLVRLIILDEVHLLHDDRGHVLEALVARTLRQSEATKELVRLVGLSATLPNYEDVATFLRVNPSSGLFYFDNSYRPAPLQQCYIGVTEKKPMKRLQLMNEICYEKVLEQAGKNQILIFVHSRKETARTARAIRDSFTAASTLGQLLPEDGASREILTTEAEQGAKDSDLKDLLPFGFGIHHAGMTRSDRALVEALFSDGHCQVLVSTATLAWGVNLPAHTVIIKGTQIYSPEKGAWAELSPLDVMQMLGRAGRPQYDTYGEGIILTAHSELQYYLSLMNNQLPIESQLVPHLPDALNAEIVLGSIASVKDAARWLSYTYLYVRMLRSPALYGVDPATLPAHDTTLLQRRLDLAHTAAVLLDKHNLARYDKRSGQLQHTTLGRVASYYYVTHPTMATFNEFLKPTLTELDLLRLFSLSAEFKNVVVRSEEKEEVRKLLERVPIPVKEAPDEPSAKVNVLLQAYISGLKLEGFALQADMVYVQQSAGRLLRAVFEICLRRGWAPLARKCLDLCKVVDHRQWLSATPMRQFTTAQGGLPDEILRRLERRDLPWERYGDLKPADLGELARQPKLGKHIHKLVHSVPKLAVTASVQPLTRGLLRLDVTLEPDFAWDGKIHGGGEAFWVCVEDADCETLLHAEAFTLKARYAEEAHTLTLHVPLTEPFPPVYFIRVLSDRWLHSESLLALPLTSLSLPSKASPGTELLDLAPLPITALKNAQYEALYTTPAPGLALKPLTRFNPVQTQAFHALYETEGNCLVAAPAGSGKTLCAELALLREFSRSSEARAVYMTPTEASAGVVMEEWELKFGAGLGKAVVQLTGEVTSDLKLVDRAHIVVCTPGQWDAVSRRWKKRRGVQEVSLYVCDELTAVGAGAGADTGEALALGGASSLLGGSNPAAVYEVVVSRLRFMASQLPHPVRLVGLSSPAANARELAEWMGCGPAATFAFSPHARPVPLEIRISGIDVASVPLRLLAMARPLYAACAQYACGGSGSAAAGGAGGGGGGGEGNVLVWAPSRRQAQITAIDLVTYAAADGQAGRFREGRASVEDIKAVLESAGLVGNREGALGHCLRHGVGYYDGGMSAKERGLVAQLWGAGALGVVVATAATLHGMSPSLWSARAVVLMGTEAYDGRAHKYVEYGMEHTLALAGRAGRGGGSDESGTAVMLVSGTRKEFVKRFLHEPLPVESRLHAALHDHFLAEIANGVIGSKQDALDYLTWTFLYRRLTANPAYYGLPQATAQHISDYLSELVDSTINDLEGSACVAVEEEVNVTPLNLGLIAAHYGCAYKSLEVFALSLTAKTRLKGLVEVLAAASEYDSLPMRHGEDASLRALAAHLPLSLPPVPEGKGAASQWEDPHTKAHLLLQAHFSRRPVPAGELRTDQARILETAVVLLAAIVDVISSEGWLKPGLAAMEMSQMVTQGCWADRDSALQQVPHLSKDLCAALAEGLAVQAPGDGDGRLTTLSLPPMESVFDLMGCDQAQLAACLAGAGLTARQVSDVQEFCARYPNITVQPTLPGVLDAASGTPLTALAPGDTCMAVVQLEREAGTAGMDEGAGIGSVYAPRFPRPRSEGWWLVLCHPPDSTILAIKRVTLAQKASVKMEFTLPALQPEQGSELPLKLYFMCDGYLGCDQELELVVPVVSEGGAPRASGAEDEEMRR